MLLVVMLRLLDVAIIHVRIEHIFDVLLERLIWGYDTVIVVELLLVGELDRPRTIEELGSCIGT